MASSHAPMNEAKRCLEDDPDGLPSPKRYSPHPACAPRLDAAALTCLLPAVHPLVRARLFRVVAWHSLASLTSSHRPKTR